MPPPDDNEATSSTPASRACPYCGGEILAKALQCRHCRKWMPEIVRAAPSADESASTGADASTPPPRARLGRESRAQPPAHLVVLSLLTLGLYELYWFWRTWRDLRDGFGVALSPGWRTAGLLVPVLNVYLVFDCVRLVHSHADAHGIEPSYRPAAVTASFFLIALAGNLTLLWVISLLNVLPLVPVQETLNRLWSRVEPAAVQRERMSLQEVAALIAGALLTAGALVVTFA